MSSLLARQLLLHVAHGLRKERETFSRLEISAKINEIKYLSAQKKVPKLTLRKELIHLENKLKGVLELEKKILQQKSTESAKVRSLKHQITVLKNKLHASENKELSTKVAKLSHLLGDYLAHKGTKEQVALSKKMLEELEIATKTKEKQKPVFNPTLVAKAEEMQSRLNSLKHEIVLHKELQTKNPEEIKAIEETIPLIQQKLREFYAKHPQLTKIDVLEYAQPVDIKPAEIKHRLLFPQRDKAEEEKMALERALPLPPPPRIEE